jgi:oligopeptide transport system ATP-binding protein
VSLLAAENISKAFPIEGGIFRWRIGTVRALRNVSFALEPGQTLGLVGESGSGKTTLARILTRMLAPDSGRLLWQGRPVDPRPERTWPCFVQMIFQDPTASLNPKLTVQTLLEEPVRQRALLSGEPRPSAAQARKETEALLADVGLSADLLPYYPHQFSGGQKQRLAIARALAMRPKVLLADEPVSALDLSIQAQILNLLKDLKERLGLAAVIISHDLTVVSYLADRILVLKDGEVVESGATGAVLSAAQHPYTRQLLDAVPRLVR